MEKVYELKGNPKHIQELLENTGMESCKAVKSPRTPVGFQDEEAAPCQLATRMQTPTECDWGRLQMVCRHLKGRLLVQA